MNVGFVILANEAEEPATFLLTAKILEKLFDDKSYNIYSRVMDYRNQNLKKKKESPIQISKTPKTKPSLEIHKNVRRHFNKLYRQ